MNRTLAGQSHTRLAVALATAVLGFGALSGCGSAQRGAPASARPARPSSGVPAALIREARPIGRGPRFQPSLSGQPEGRCTPTLGPRVGVHVELFAANRVVLVASGIGTKPPRSYSEGRISGAGCYGELVTLEPTGVVLVRPGAHPPLANLFRSWGQPLTARRLASFTESGPDGVRVYVDGHRWLGPPAQVPLVAHSEIVLEIGPYVPPHSRYTFPPGS